MQFIVISALGSDRTGLVYDLTRVVLDCSGNIHDSRMSAFGSEFAMLLLDSSREEAFRRLDAIRLSLRSKAVEWTPGERIQVTLSIGFSMFPEDGTESVRLLGLADERLLAGKRAGRDVVVAEAEPDRHSMKTAAAS